MFLKINTAKILIQIGYSKREIANSETSTTDADGVVTITYNYGSGNSCVECTDGDEDVWVRLGQLSDYVKSVAVTGDIYNIKYYTAKRDAEEIKDVDGNSHDPKQYVQSHFVGQDDTKDARLLAEQWTQIRAERDRLLTSSDWTQGADTPLGVSKKTEWTTYRQDLRNIPEDQTAKTTYADIIWPSQPS